MSKHTPKKFIQKAIKRTGALTRKAKAAGLNIIQFSNKALAAGSKATTLTKQQSRFFKFTLLPIIKKRRKAKA